MLDNQNNDDSKKDCNQMMIFEGTQVLEVTDARCTCRRFTDNRKRMGSSERRIRWWGNRMLPACTSLKSIYKRQWQWTAAAYGEPDAENNVILKLHEFQHTRTKLATAVHPAIRVPLIPRNESRLSMPSPRRQQPNSQPGRALISALGAGKGGGGMRSARIIYNSGNDCDHIPCF